MFWHRNCVSWLHRCWVYLALSVGSCVLTSLVLGLSRSVSWVVCPDFVGAGFIPLCQLGRVSWLRRCWVYPAPSVGSCVLISSVLGLKIFCRWPTMMKIRCTKIFQRWSDEVRIALLGYMKPVRGFPDHRRLFFFSHLTNSMRVRLAPCVAYTYRRLSRKLIFSAFNFRQCAQLRKYNSTKISRSTVLIVY